MQFWRFIVQEQTYLTKLINGDYTEELPLGEPGSREQHGSPVFLQDHVSV